MRQADGESWYQVIGSLGSLELLIIAPLLGVPVGFVIALIAGGYQPGSVEQIYPTNTIRTASPRQRLGAYLLDAVLAYSTLGIGWFIWFVIVAPRGQTPAKQLLNMYVLHDDGARAGGGYIWLRELVIKGLLFGVISLFTLYLVWFFAALWCVWDRDRQCLWDKVGSTFVAYSPLGIRPHTKTEAALAGGALLPATEFARGQSAPAPSHVTPGQAPPQDNNPAQGVFCSSCGTRADEAAQFCMSCGKLLGS